MRFLRFEEIATAPDEDAFIQVVKLAQAVFERAGAIRWALLHGSFLGNRVTPASDLDIMLCLHDEHVPPGIERRNLEIIREVYACAGKLHVPLDVYITRPAELRTGLHTLNAGYQQYLISMCRFDTALKGDRDVIRDDLVVASVLLTQRKDQAAIYIASKLRKARQALAFSTHERETDVWVDWLGEVLTVWRYAALRYIEAFETLPRLGIGFNEEFVLRSLKAKCPSARDSYETLQNLRRDYVAELAQQRESPHPERWRYMQGRVEFAGEALHEFLLSLSREITF